MKGIILNFSIESDRGAISGDDGNRYNFSSHNWKDTKEFPKRGLRVDFDIEEKTATEIYLALEEIRLPSPSPQKQSFSISESEINLEQKQILGIIGSLILLLGIFTPLIRFPWLGTLSLTSNFNCLIVIVLAIASFVFSIKQNYQRLWFTGISSLFFTFLNFVSFFQKILQTKATLNNELANNTYGISGGFVAVAGNFIQAVVIATAKERGFKSYAGAVSFSNGQYNVITCITIKPSKEIAIPIFSGNTLRCASGSEEDR